MRYAYTKSLYDTYVAPDLGPELPEPTGGDVEVALGSA
jgi:hypothetical protein